MFKIVRGIYRNSIGEKNEKKNRYLCDQNGFFRVGTNFAIQQTSKYQISKLVVKLKQ
jgi:hypothetical protein